MSVCKIYTSVLTLETWADFSLVWICLFGTPECDVRMHDLDISTFITNCRHLTTLVVTIMGLVRCRFQCIRFNHQLSFKRNGNIIKVINQAKKTPSPLRLPLVKHISIKVLCISKPMKKIQGKFVKNAITPHVLFLGNIPLNLWHHLNGLLDRVDVVLRVRSIML